METLIFVLGVLSGTVLIGLCYIVMELLKIKKQQKAKEKEIAEAYGKFESVEKDFNYSREKSVQDFRREMDNIYRKIDQDIKSIEQHIENFKKKEFWVDINKMNQSLENLNKRVSSNDEAVRSYIDSRIDKATRGIALVAEGVKNYQESSHEELIEKVLEKIDLKRKEENIKRVTEGLPISGY